MRGRRDLINGVVELKLVKLRLEWKMNGENRECVRESRSGGWARSMTI